MEIVLYWHLAKLPVLGILVQLSLNTISRQAETPLDIRGKLINCSSRVSSSAYVLVLGFQVFRLGVFLWHSGLERSPAGGVFVRYSERCSTDLGCPRLWKPATHAATIASGRHRVSHRSAQISTFQFYLLLLNCLARFGNFWIPCCLV